MTKEQVLKKFGSPDIHRPRREYSLPKVMPTPTPMPGLLGMVIAQQATPTVVEETHVQIEQFRYFNQDGSLVTYVQFSEDGRVTEVVRAPPPQK
jgi:hypothetical protein